MEDRLLQYKGEKHPRMPLETSNLSLVGELKLKPSQLQKDVQSSMGGESLEREGKILDYWINSISTYTSYFPYTSISTYNSISTHTSYFTTSASVEKWPHGMVMASSAIVNELDSVLRGDFDLI